MSHLRCLLSAGLLVLPALVGAMDLSGSVFGVDRKPISGVQVRLVGGNVATTTDAKGEWKIVATTTRAGQRDVRTGDTPRAFVVVENGRIRVRLAGRDLAGRGVGGVALPASENLVAGRVLGIQDTLTFSLGGRILLRDTVSASRTGIVRILDSNFHPAIVYGQLTDSRDGRNYRTVKIGSQVWMAENLDFKKGNGSDSGWWYDGSPDSGAKYGRLYKWAALMNLPDSCNSKKCVRIVQPLHRGLCPEGWHVPSDAEWDTLMVEVGGAGTAATKLKSSNGWNDSGNGTDEHGFRAVPGGFVYNGSSIHSGFDGSWWSGTEGLESNARFRIAFAVGVGVDRNYQIKTYGFSARCIQGSAPDQAPGRGTAAMKLIPAGSFLMGSPMTEAGRSTNETQHKVNLSAFWMDSTHVTQGQYQSLIGLNPSNSLGCGTTCPVDEVTWFDAILYCNARSKREGFDTVYAYTSMTGSRVSGVMGLGGLVIDLGKNGYRLPTEAQWEYAARGGTTTAYYWGDEADSATVGRHAWYSGNSGWASHPVATRIPNSYGLYDMAGNEWQWTNDWFGSYPTVEQTDPHKSLIGSSRVRRGGGKTQGASILRSAFRDAMDPDFASSRSGFRCVLPAR